MGSLRLDSLPGWENCIYVKSWLNIKFTIFTHSRKVVNQQLASQLCQVARRVQLAIEVREFRCNLIGFHRDRFKLVAQQDELAFQAGVAGFGKFKIIGAAKHTAASVVA